MIQAHYIYYVLYFRDDCISSTSDHQAFDPEGWGPLLMPSNPRVNLIYNDNLE